MSSRLPERVDPWRLADQGKVLSGRCALADFPRLAPLLADTTGEAEFRLAFLRDEERRPVIRGEVRTILRLTCQRCLESVDLPIDSRFTLGIVTGMDEIGLLPDDYESLLADEGEVVPRDIVEDELLLCLPAVPRHTEACNSRLRELEQDAAGSSEGGPFAALAALKKRQT